MFDFEDVIAANKTEQIRAWSIEKALDHHRNQGMRPLDDSLIRTANSIEQYILNGKKADDG